MDLFQNPFYILNASVRDDRRRIHDLVEACRLTQDETLCTEAFAALTHPRRRLTAEIAWLPGLDQSQIVEVIDLLLRDPASLIDIPEIPPLTRLNLLASGIHQLKTCDVDQLVPWVVQMAFAQERIDARAVFQTINTDRRQAGFPEVTDLSAIDEELNARHSHCLSVLRQVMDGLLPDDRRNLVTRVIEISTQHCGLHDLPLVSDLVYAYEVIEQAHLQEATQCIETDLENIRALVQSGISDCPLYGLVDRLCTALRQWHIIAQPMKLCARSLGVTYEPVRRLGWTLQRVTLDLRDELHRVEMAIRIAETMTVVFAEDFQIAEQIRDDLSDLRYLRPRLILTELRRKCADAISRVEHAGAYVGFNAHLQETFVKGLLSKLEDASPDDEVRAEARRVVADMYMRCAIALAGHHAERQTAWEWFQLALQHADSESMRATIRQKQQETLNRPWTVRGATRRLWQGVQSQEFRSWVTGVLVYLLIIFFFFLMAMWGSRDEQANSYGSDSGYSTSSEDEEDDPWASEDTDDEDASEDTDDTEDADTSEDTDAWEDGDGYGIESDSGRDVFGSDRETSNNDSIGLRDGLLSLDDSLSRKDGDGDSLSLD